LLITLFINPAYSKAYKGAEYRTKEGFIYGRFEVCYKPPAADGMLANFFTYHDFTTGTIDWNEIDIEILGRYEDDLQFTIIGPRQFIYNSHRYVDFNPTEDYHVYAFEWTPDYVAWFVDGQEMYRQTGEHISQLVHPQQLMMNIWAPDGDGTWPGVWNPEILPVFAYYDWVSYASYAPGNGDTGTDNNFKWEWRDDFDGWDQDRWTKATHTWGGNRVDFMTENVVFKDGKVILCLTDENNLGYVDNNPPRILWARAGGNKLTVHFTEPVDSVTAENPASYSIPGVTVFSAKQLRDPRTVEVSISPLDTTKSYNLVVFGMKDTPPGNNTSLYHTKNIIHAKTLKFPLGINAGGKAIYQGAYLPDQVWGPTVEYGRMDGYVDRWAAMDFAGTDEDSLYFNSIREVVKYKIRVTDGVYDVTLFMAENWFSEAGKRIFSVTVEGKEIMTDLDIYKEVGKYHAFTVKAEEVTVDDGTIDIHFSNWTDKPTLSGIRVDQISTTIESQSQPHSMDFGLYPNYPNPFNAQTTLRYTLAFQAEVNLRVYDTLGREVTVLFEGNQPAGSHSLNFDASNLAGGIYYYRMVARYGNGVFEKAGKMLLLK
jgi:hypothetical protein